MTSPTQRTLRVLQEWGYLAQVVERWCPHSRRRIDLFGVIDVLGLLNTKILAIQCTSASGAATRRAKIEDHSHLHELARTFDVEVWGWRKNSKKRWVANCWSLQEDGTWSPPFWIDAKGRRVTKKGEIIV